MSKKSYTAVWLIGGLDADSPIEAAKLAYEIQRDPESTATIFTVLADEEAMNLVIPGVVVDVNE